MYAIESPLLPLAQLAECTGLSADILRMWERRFGFPGAERGPDGEPLYRESQIRRLRLLRALVTLGARPVELMRLDERDLVDRLCHWQAEQEAEMKADALALGDCLDMVRCNACTDLEARLRSHIIAHGLQRFVTMLAAPLCTVVGHAWERGELSVFQEHLFADVLDRTLRGAACGLFQPDLRQAGRATPAVLLACPPGEQHTLGLAMAEALFRLADCHCLNLGRSAPLGEITHAAQAHRIDIVALSFSQAYPAAQAIECIVYLRAALDRDTALWVGGQCAGLQQGVPDGVMRHETLDGLGQAVAAWRAAKRPAGGDQAKRW